MVALKNTYIYICVLLRYNHDALIHFQYPPSYVLSRGIRSPFRTTRNALGLVQAAAPKVAVGKKAEVAVGPGMFYV